MEARFPSKLKFLFSPMRYKGARGGRGSAKSWGFARAILILGTKKKIRVLCAREFQNSLKDSVHKLLSDQIEILGLSKYYKILENTIRGINGTEIVYTGLSTQTVDSIKSFEGVDICWVEEAQVVKKKSWDLLIPTIRKPGSEIWFTFNPELDTDETYVRFVENPPDECICVVMNHTDNPWFPDVLEKERLHCLKTDPKAYPNIWEGKCKPAVEGAIYYDEITAAQDNGQITIVPYDPRLKAHVVFDLGWNDAMAVSVVQRSTSDIRIINYFEDSHKKIDWYSDKLKEMKYNWGQLFLPHDGNHADFKTGMTTGQIMEDFGWDIEYTPNIGVEPGIKLVRHTFPRIYFDRTNTKQLVECVKRYKRGINKMTNTPGTPVHDDFSHGADNLRYICVNAESMRNESQYNGPVKAVFNYQVIPGINVSKTEYNMQRM